MYGATGLKHNTVSCALFFMFHNCRWIVLGQNTKNEYVNLFKNFTTCDGQQILLEIAMVLQSLEGMELCCMYPNMTLCLLIF